MNSKQLKKLRKLIKPLQVEWLQSILPEDQGKVITVDNVEELMPEKQANNFLRVVEIHQIGALNYP